jgi:hypothetical protein
MREPLSLIDDYYDNKEIGELFGKYYFFASQQQTAD